MSILKRNTLSQVFVKKTKAISHEERQVNKQPLKGKHSAYIKENNNEIVKLRNEISDFKELILTLMENITAFVKQYTIFIDDE